MILELSLIGLILAFLTIIISSLPLYVSIKLLGSRVGIFKTFLIILLIGFVNLMISIIIPKYGVILGFIFTLLIIREGFKLKWYKSLIAWILWMFFIILFTSTLTIFGLSYVFYKFIF